MPRNDDIPQTMREAEAAGWQGLSLYCLRCRRQIVRSWGYLRARTDEETLVGVFAHCRCYLCGRRPSIAKLAVNVPTAWGSWLREKRIEFSDGRTVRPSRE